MAANENEKSGIEKKQAWWLPSIYIFFRVSAWIAFPVIAALYIGDWLDTKYHTANRWLLISVGIAFVASMAGLVRTTIVEWRKLNQVSSKQADGRISNKPAEK